MGELNMSENKILKPEVIVFAGPNGSGKSTITRMAKTVGRYINADEIKRATLCTDIEAAQKAEQLRNQAIDEHADFTFETVLISTPSYLFINAILKNIISMRKDIF